MTTYQKFRALALRAAAQDYADATAWIRRTPATVKEATEALYQAARDYVAAHHPPRGTRGTRGQRG